MDVETLLLIGAIMGVFVTSRPFVRALAEWGSAFYTALVWFKRRMGNELYDGVTSLDGRVRALEQSTDEHQSAVDLHPSLRRRREREERNL